MKHKTLTYAPTLLLVIYVLLGLSDVFLAAVQDASSNAFLSVSIVEFLVLAMPVAFYCGLNRLSFLKVVEVRPIAWRDVPFALYVLFAFLFGCGCLKFVTGALFTPEVARSATLITTPLYTSNTPLVVLCFILLPALLEQVVFSGLVLNLYRPYGALVAVCVSALTYAMAHFSLHNFVYYFFCGFLLALLTQVTRSVLPAMVVSAFATFADLYYQNQFLEYVSSSGSGTLLFYFFGVLFLLFCVLAVAHLERSYARRARSVQEGAKLALEEEVSRRRRTEGAEASEEEDLTFAHRLRMIFLSPVFILLVVVFLLFATKVL